MNSKAVEPGYQCGQSISELYSAAGELASSVGGNVAGGAMLSTRTLDLGTVRELKQQLVSEDVLPCKKGKFMGAVSPNVLGDIYNATTVNNSIVDLWKFANMEKFGKMAGADQTMEIELPGTNIVFRQTPFVARRLTTLAAERSLRTYVFGNATPMIDVWLEVPGDTDLDEGDWRTIECRVVTDAPPSSFDPTATIGGWASYKFHQTVTLPPATVLTHSAYSFY